MNSFKYHFLSSKNTKAQVAKNDAQRERDKQSANSYKGSGEVGSDGSVSPKTSVRKKKA